MDCNDTFISKINITDKNAYLKIVWKNSEQDLFCIQILFQNQCWTGRFSYETAKKFREKLQKDEEEYEKEVKEALTHCDNMYTFQLSPFGDSKTATFSWKKKFAETTAVVLHGSMNVECNTKEITNETIIEYLLDQNKNLRSTIEEYQKRNFILQEDLNKCRNDFEKFVDVKSSLENNLYGKFMQLLNAKKRRIQLLENDLHTDKKTDKK